MPRLSMWNPNKGNDYKFFDRIVREQFEVGGTGVIVHKYIGPEEGPNLDDPAQPNLQDQERVNETSIQDLLLLENRDRKYDHDLYELKGVYNVTDNDFDLTAFGLFLTNDVIYMNFHLNTMVEILGRKLMSGDVLELPHLIEDYSLDADNPPIPKFYTVTDGNRGSEGFSASWWPHIWRVKLEPITDSQEFDDIIGNSSDNDSLTSYISSYNRELDITQAVVESAAQNDPVGGNTTLIDHLFNYVKENGFSWDPGEPILSGSEFPSDPNQGDFFIRTDFQPNRLFIYRDNKWIRLYDNIDNKTWSDRTFNASTFINNQTTDVAKGQEYESRQSISDAIKPRDDFDGNT